MLTWTCARTKHFNPTLPPDSYHGIASLKAQNPAFNVASFPVNVFSSLHIIALVWITFHIQNGLLASITTVTTGKMIRVKFSALVGLEACSLKLFLPRRHFFVGSIRVKPEDSTSLICRSECRRSLSHQYTHCMGIATTYDYFLNSNDLYFLKSYKYLLLNVSNLLILTLA